MATLTTDHNLGRHRKPFAGCPVCHPEDHRFESPPVKVKVRKGQTVGEAIVEAVFAAANPAPPSRGWPRKVTFHGLDLTGPEPVAVTFDAPPPGSGITILPAEPPTTREAC